MRPSLSPVLFAAAVSGQALAADVPLDARATYLRLNDDPALAASPLALAALGAVPGDYIRLQSVGDFDNGPDGDTFESLVGVFSSTSTLLPSANQERVPDAIDVGFEFQTANTWRGNLPTDIAEDFLISHHASFGYVIVRVPAGAEFLFVTPSDSLFYDNTDPDADFGLRVELVPCPADTSGDGAVNTIDFITFLNLWNAEDRLADYDSNGVINTVDVITFLNLWTGGC
ncbi:MAG TPA: GC-type dockerin domain-anchored protein [Phycisphaerales bacterium]|nr:GC-type dockerin domain-anchored protein [Phycisphaerales bacterium]